MKNNTKYLKFYKELDKWYVYLKYWTGSKDDLEMVLGADTMLDILSEGNDSVNLCISSEEFEGYKYLLTKTHSESDGYWYDLTSEHINFPVWLCYVTTYIYGNFPDKIYISDVI